MELFNEFENLLKEKKLNALDLLQQGKSIEVIKNALGTIGISNEDLVNLYSWRDGISSTDFYGKTIEELEMFPDVIMPSLNDAIGYFSLYVIEKSAWGKFLFPVFTNGGGDFLLLNIDSGNQEFGMIYLYSPSLLLSEDPMTIYDSLEFFFLTMNECLKEGIYIPGSNGSLDVDYDIKYKVSAEINVRSDYWKNYN